MLWIKNNFKYLIVIILLGATVLVWYAVFAESRSGLTVAFLDVGQGDAIFIQAENGNQILLDGGPNKAALNQLSKVMPFYDRSIDMVIASHPDSDHISGLIEVLKRYKVYSAMEPGTKSDNVVYQEFENLVKEKNIQDIFAGRDMRVNLDNGLYLDILLPVVDPENLDPHAGMLVIRLVYGKNSFLLTGDMEKSLEGYLVFLEGHNLKTDVLKVGHHGSRTSTSEVLLGFSAPEYAVISVGKDNQYGHPHKETLDILNKFQIPILRTDESGMIKIKSDGEQIFIY
ncbi:MAG: MBL fold metallo-hydrolase [Candidatus Tagabacteria bacterium CG_4_10_14_0_2_um_filter_40_13]|uniref:MBL fold metallo-hydrolase n=2 Tax=Candidatus Tagaibacteriota TaxID=1817918 RepID=A0A2M7B977_9BACT|nr:MAG: MBL fold metallo-hydrolase [Candidatus Tagabacteria bacterium CG03_land_8_20_14_0_80_41_22]PIZ56395.1 MAG: MBL fold metallo-hydrolase [Candidatus Tagabacteria bacterium CG_4_10_14_0_2_um_filter_40_13]